MKYTRRTAMTLAAAAAATFAVGPARASSKIVSTEEAMTELVLGDPNAKVEVIEYASLSCPACKYFHQAVWPELKSEYVDTGKVKFIYRDFPTNTPALAAAMISRCAGPTRHKGMLDIFFDTQDQWLRSENPLQAMGMVARMAGLGPSDIDACLKNADLMNGIQNAARVASEEKGVRSTPTLFVAGEPSENGMDWNILKAEIDDALAKAN